MGPIIGFFGEVTEQSKQDAIAYIKKNGWTMDDVRLVPSEQYKAYLVVAKRRLW
jgi:hypothetical protein